jgi:tetratricopeptide (TPR) repeat protein
MRSAGAALILAVVCGADACGAGFAEAGACGFDDDSYRVLGRALLAQGRWLEAELPLRCALMARPGDAAILLELGRVLLGQGRHAECEQAAFEAVACDARVPEAWLLLSRARAAGARRGEAIDALEAAALLEVDCGPEAAWLLGDLYFAEQLPRRAGDAYARALERGTPPAGSLRRVCAAFLAAGDGARARTFAEALLAREPEDGEALRVLGELALAADEFESAGELLARALKSDPRAGGVLLARGALAARQGRSSEALAYYRTARALPEWKEAALRAEAGLLIEEARWDEALQSVRLLQSEFARGAWEVLARDIERGAAGK